MRESVHEIRDTADVLEQQVMALREEESFAIRQLAATTNELSAISRQIEGLDTPARRRGALAVMSLATALAILATFIGLLGMGR